MRISALSSAAGVPVATIKFYLREGLLAPGTATAQTQARYDDSHVERLRLIRALVEAAGLSLTQVRDVVDHLDHPPQSWHDVLGIAHAAATAAPGRSAGRGRGRPAGRSRAAGAAGVARLSGGASGAPAAARPGRAEGRGARRAR